MVSVFVVAIEKVDCSLFVQRTRNKSCKCLISPLVFCMEILTMLLQESDGFIYPLALILITSPPLIIAHGAFCASCGVC